MRLGRGPGEPARTGRVTEDPVVRQYRFLLRTAPLDALEAAHVAALPRLDAADRDAILQAVRSAFAAGGRLRADDTAPVAHLLVWGERRAPGAFLAACPTPSLQRLARTVVGGDEVFGLFSGYAAWDGADPPAERHEEWMDAGFDPDSGRWNSRRSVPMDTSTGSWASNPGSVGETGGA